MKLHVCSLLLLGSTFAAEIPIADADALRAAGKTVQPGDVLVLREGVWADSRLKFRAMGTKENPITLRAASPGKTVLTGASRLSFSGSYVVVEGLWFQNVSQAQDEVIELRTDDEELAEHCVVKNCAITDDLPLAEKTKDGKWVSLYGTGNVIENCSFFGKKTGGTLMVAWLAEGIMAKHEIRGCYFGPRAVLGKNGGEILRLGDSKSNLLQTECRVEGCLFDRCNGEGEIVSNKSCGNVYSGNTFLECEGALTLRHGHRCVVEQNWFLGNNKKDTGGVRVIGEDHKVQHNTFQDLAGDEYRCGLTFMVGDTKSNGYQQVRNVLIANNTWVNCKNTALLGKAHDKKCTFLPETVTMKDNVMLSPGNTLIEKRSEIPGWVWEGNVLSGASIGMDLPAGDASACQKDVAGHWRMPSGSKAGAQMTTQPLAVAEVGPRTWAVK
jgi:poly(beta-D-mannuronate) lyase